MKTVLYNFKICMKTRLRVLFCYVWPILLYGCEAWTLRKTDRDRLEAAEMWFFRRMMKIPWTARMTNVAVLQTAGYQRKMLATIKRRQMKFLGHVYRKGSIENLALTGKINGKRSRGRQRIIFMDQIMEWKGATAYEVFDLCRRRQLVADVS